MSSGLANPLAPFAVRFLSFVILLLPGQDSGTPALIRQLGSADAAERSAAYELLKGRGEEARPGLKEALRDPDSEIAARAGTLLRRLDLLNDLPRNAARPLPETLDRLAQGENPEWVSLYLSISKLDPGSGESRRWLEKYARQAFRSAETPEEKKGLCDALGDLSLSRKPLGEVVRFLRDPGDGVREKAIETLSKHVAFEADEGLAALLEDLDPATRSAAVEALGKIFESDALPLLQPLLRDPSPEVRRSVLSTLSRSVWEGRNDRIRILLDLLKDPDGDIRGTAADMLAAATMPDGPSAEGAGPLISALLDKEPLVRARSAEALGNWKAAEATPALLDRLRKDPEPQVRRSAAWSLGEIAARRALPELLAHAEDPKEDVGVRAAALDALSELKAPEGLKTARSLLAEAQPELRLSAVRVLLAMEDRASAGALALLFSDGTEVPANSVVDLLVQKRPAWMAESVTGLLEDPSWKVRRRALLVLRALRPEKMMPAVVRRLADNHPEVQDAAMWGRDFVRTPEAARELRKLLREGTADARRRAVESAFFVLGSSGAEDLVPLLDDEDPLVRASAIKALGGLERPGDLPGFARHLGDPDPSVRERAADAILEQRGWSALPDIRTWAAAGPEEARPEVLRLLSNLGESHLPEIMALLSSGNAAVQLSALQVLNGLDAKESIDSILPLLGSPNAKIQTVALETLAELGARAALPRIRPLLEHEDPSVRAAAIDALADLGDRESIPAALKMLEAGDSAHACEFLAAVGARESVPQLEKALAQDPVSLNDALRALGRLGATASAPKVFARFGADIRWSGSLVAETLGVLDAREFIPDLRKYLRHRSRHLRSQAAVALGGLHATEAVADLLPLLKDPDNDVVGSAAEALGRIGAQQAIPGIREALRGRSWDAELSWWPRCCGVGAAPRRGPLLEALVRLGAREAVPDLLEILRTETPALSNDVVAALRFLRDPDSRAAVVDHVLKHSEPFSDPSAWPEAWNRVPRVLLSGDPELFRRVPYSTAELLAELGAKDLAPDLVRLLDVGPRNFRLSAANALCLLGSNESVPFILQESGHGETGGLTFLNALRLPALWGRMAGTRFPRTRTLSKRGLWKEIARTLGVRLEMPEEAYSRASVDCCERFDVLIYEDLFSLADVARELLSWTSYQMILEDDRIRIVREKEAVQFWKQWAGR